jgi:O-antigen/teichoic acid export membrane protein
MLKKFTRNLALVLFLNLLIKPFWILGIDRSVQNMVGAEDYGFYNAILSFSFLLNILLDFGITNFNNKNISQNNHLLRKHLSSIIVLKLMLGGLYMVATLIAGFIIGFSKLQILLLIVLGFNQFLISFTLYLRSNLAGLHLFKLDSFISVLDRTMMIVICAFLLWGNLPITFTIRAFVFAQTIAYALTTLITLIIVFHKAKSKFLKLNWSLPFSIMIIKKSFPFAILVLLMTFYNRIDAVMLERILPNPEGAKQSGIYASAYRLLDAANMIAFLFAGLLLPIFSKMLKHKESIEKLVSLAFVLLFVPASIVSMGSYFYSHDLMKLMYDEHITASASAFGILMFCFVPISTTYIFGTLLTANGNLKQLNIVAASGMVINITLNFVLIPYFQGISSDAATGSSFASITTQMFTAITQVILAKYIFHFKINIKLIIQLMVFVIGIFLINYFSTKLPYSWVINFGSMIISSFVFALLIRLLSIKSLYNLVKYGE